MNESELRQVEQELREALVDVGLRWVLDEIDDAIAAGVPEEKILRRRSHRTGSEGQPYSSAEVAEQYEVVGLVRTSGKEYEASRRRGDLVIAPRPMTLQERVRLLLDALRRILIELPEIELEITKTLREVSDGDEGSRTEVNEVTFEPDENSRSRRESLSIHSSRLPRERRERVRELLNEIVSEVRN